MKLLNAVFWTAFAVSVVHYTDNYVNFEKFPQGGGGPTVTDDMIWIAWVVFTVVGLTGYLLYRRGRVTAGAGCFAFYAGSGLVGLGHYTEPGMTDAVWWRQGHVLADILCGIAVLAFAIWSVRRERAGRLSAA